MDLELSQDQKMFRSTARSFLDKEMPLTAVRELGEKGGGFDREWWSTAAELGWAAMIVPEELGGGSVSGEGLVDLAIVAEELGRTVAPGALLQTNIVIAGLVEAHGDGADHDAEIEGLMSGELIGTWAVYESGHPFQPLTPSVTAKSTGDGWVIDGAKDRVELADQADLLLVTVSTDDGPAQLLVPTSAAGVTIEPAWSLDIVKRYSDVRFDGVTVPAGALVGTVAGTPAVIERQIQVANVLQCAEICGALDAVFAFTVQWAFDRYSFGRPLASYQALKHRFADMKMWIEAINATTSGAVHAVQERSDKAGRLVSAAKSYVATKAPQIVQDCVQMHGGLGVTWEHDLHLYLRRVTTDAALYGTAQDHRRRITDFITA